MNTKQLVLIITAVALIALTIGCKTNGQEKTVKPVRVKTVETHTGASVVRYSASIRPSSQVEIAFKVGGYVESIKSAEGRHIQAGDIVMKGGSADAAFNSVSGTIRVTDGPLERARFESVTGGNRAILAGAIKRHQDKKAL